jgi:hypothetical protein
VENDNQNIPSGSTSKVRAAIIGGSIMAATSVVPYLSFINCACCAGIMLGGLASVYFYIKDMPKDELPLEVKYGVLLGAFAGLFGALIETFITVMIIKIFSNEYFEGIYNEFQKSIDQMESNGQHVPALLTQVRDSFVYFIQEIKSTGFSPILTIVMLVFNTIKDILFGLFGGLIGVYVLQRRSKTPDLKSN